MSDRTTDVFAQARDLFLEGVGHFDAGRHDAAEQRFEASLALLPGRPSTLANLGAARVRLGKWEAALEALGPALALEPGDADAWSHQGIAQAALGRHQDALDSHDRALALDIRRAANWIHRGLALQALRRHGDALAAFATALGLQPSRADAWFRHGQTLQFLDRHDEALASYEKALALDPTLGEAWSLRGGILRDLMRLDEAAVAFEQAIASGADPELNRYFLASVSGRTLPPTAPAAYVEPLFDDYAETFEQHLVGALRYQAHTTLVEHLCALGSRRYASALDLGCGTGLCGPLVRPIVDALDGVDLSRNMLEKARALGVYDHLVQADIASHLQATERRHDLVLAADVFIYVGDLAAVFDAVRRVTVEGAVFCFSAEPADDAKDFELLPSLRYAHSERYLRALASRCGFEPIRIVAGPIREDQRRPIPGLFVYLRRV